MRTIVALVIGVCLMATTAFAAPAENFNDLPRSHWAYEAVSMLAKEGIVDGYPDKTFKGDKTMTRYEMAQIVAKAMANQAKANIALRALIDKLAVEFALDMNRINARIDKVEKDQKKVKFSGELSQQYKSKEDSVGKKQSYGQEKFKLNIVGQVDKDTTVTVRIADPAPSATMFKDSSHHKYGEFATNGRIFDNMYGTTKVGAFKVKVGRQPLVTDPEDIIVDSDFFSFDGISFGTKLKDFDFSYSRGRFARGLDSGTVWAFNGFAKSEFQNVDVQTLSLGTELGKLNLNVNWVEFEKSKKNNPNVTLMAYDVYQADWAFNDKFLVGFEYGKNTKAVDEGAFSSVKAVFGHRKLDRAGKQSLTVTHSDFKKNSLYYAYSSMDCPDEDVTGDRFTNLDFAYKLALSKSLSLKLEYGDIKDKTTPSENYKFWKLTTKWKF
ncbi:S-layer homology domain-containing protein [Anaeroselena agilis]|uniref:S-layer homology domain-containing protein n=1 Tax=Anaeroselena agilis TaxID=3063788 RepID=A0ABU3NUL0_9FIRM|nr:S-layer homology domain-containing protein [Selenomonadales bacterium 4137-cl]